MVRRHPDTSERRLDRLSWGFIPSFAKEAKGGRKPINARSETVAFSGMFRGAFERRRCLMLMDAFYEWQTTPTGKQPSAFAGTDGQPLVLAGLWDCWRAPDGEVRRTFAVLTTAADAFIGRIHDRMPVVLEAEDWPVWLGKHEGRCPLPAATGGREHSATLAGKPGRQLAAA